MNTLIVKCNKCGIYFERKKGEHNRSIKLNRPEYCSRSCVGKILNDNIKKNPILIQIRLKNLEKGGRKQNIFSPFKSLIRNIKNRCKNGKTEYHITIEDLKDLWDKQDGRCFYSGIKMNLPKNSNGFKGKPLMENCSVDRIDSNKPYQRDNIVLCCYGANIGKGIWNKEEYIYFCKLVSKYNNGDE